MGFVCVCAREVLKWDRDLLVVFLGDRLQNFRVILQQHFSAELDGNIGRHFRSDRTKQSESSQGTSAPV